MSTSRSSVPRYQDPHASSGTPRTPLSARRSSHSEDGNLIVTRGLQEILESEMRKKKPEEPPTARAHKGKPRKSSGRAPGTAPAFLFCYLCGRQFGKASIEFHRPQCFLKKMIEWERTAPERRGPRPMDPAMHERMVQEQVHAMKGNGRGGGTAGRGAAAATNGRGAKMATTTDTDLYNKIQYDSFNTNALKACPHCARTFLPDRLEVHLRSCKPGATAKPVGKGAAATTAAAALASRAEDVPIKASGSYELPPDAGADAVPPGATTKSPSAARSSLRSATAMSVNPSEEPPARASAVAAFSGSTSMATKSASHRSSLRRVSIMEPAVVVCDSDRDSVSVDAELPPPSLSERRLSGSAQRETMESSSPHRPASMEPAPVLEPTAARSLSSLPLAVSETPTGSAASLPRTPSATASLPRSAPRPAAAVSMERETEESEDTPEESSLTPRRKIPLNNVSHFKNVQSRLKVELQAQEETLTPCCYCGRKFNPERVEKHQSVCIERNKTPTSTNSRPKGSATPRSSLPVTTNGSGSRNGSGTASKKQSPATKSITPLTSKQAFCTACGSAFSSSAPNFCGACGAKVA